MKVGLTKEEIEKLLNSDDFSKEVREDEDNAYAEGVQGVPYFMVGNEVINGAASKESMKNTLLKVLNKKKKKKKNERNP